MERFQSIDASGLTHPGRMRSVNEDHFLIGQLDKSLLITATSLSVGDQRRLIGAAEGQVFCVADGLGGHAAGERASATAVDTTAEYLVQTMPCIFQASALTEGDLRRELTAAVRRAQRAVRERASQDSSMRGMGTTLTMGFLRWPQLYLVHVGDSRAYLLRDELRRLTTDHTVLQQLLDTGRMRPGEAHDSLLAHSLWNVVGDSAHDAFVDISIVELLTRDTLLLCTDGLVRHVSDPAIREILRTSSTAAEASRNLIDAANAGGGTDNVTVIVVRMPPVVDATERAEHRLAQDPPTHTPPLAAAGPRLPVAEPDR